MTKWVVKIYMTKEQQELWCLITIKTHTLAFDMMLCKACLLRSYPLRNSLCTVVWIASKHNLTSKLEVEQILNIIITSFQSSRHVLFKFEYHFCRQQDRNFPKHWGLPTKLPINTKVEKKRINYVKVWPCSNVSPKNRPKPVTDGHHFKDTRWTWRILRAWEINYYVS